MAGNGVAAPTWSADVPRSEARARMRAALGAWIRSEPLTALAAEWGAAPPRDVSDDDLFGWFDKLSDKHWNFRRGAERNQAVRANLTPAQKRAAVATASALGLVEPRPPSRRYYDYVLILGGLVRACLVRPAYAAKLSRSGVVFGNVTALGGFRPLAGDELDLASALGIAAGNEMDAILLGMARAFDLRGEPEVNRSASGRTGNGDWAVARFPGRPDLSVVAAPSSEPAVRRANTADTFGWWAGPRRQSLWKAHVLLITTAIYVPYQEAGAIRTVAMPYGATVETVGVPADIADLGAHTQPFGPDDYLQEIRSAIRGYRDLLRDTATEDQ
ncbi:hypothetical protein GCM10027598_47500 [Amycolatopsis oliviviridis]|uniref:Uncharacterized protein n=1 Tax=Amycolatopsis oliviviridis TaxID=1471590 RepID=A0ABQ3MAA2_9PSEU|nr:hypothetical protein [Amycolatopsis oliviviridis]GHH37697.1 hypothetical protein GCM10017790_82350 [Amycolatopsis oliviviridis]